MTMPSWYDSRRVDVALAQLQGLVADDMAVCDNCTYANKTRCTLHNINLPDVACAYYRAECPCGRPMKDYRISGGMAWACDVCDRDDINDGFGCEPGDAHYYKSP